MAKQGQKLDPELKEKIKAYLATCDNISQTAKKFGVSVSTVHKIKEEKPDEFEKLRNDKKQQIIDRIWENIWDAIELGNQMVKEAREGKRDIPLSHISTYVGTLYDKQALMQGDPTQNINGGMVIHIGIPDTAEDDE